MSEAIPTSAQFKAVHKAWDRIEKIGHDCPPETWTTMISTPGWAEPEWIGSARWCCDICAPMFAESVTKACGSAQIRVTP